VGFDIAPNFGRTDVYEQNHNLIFEAELPGMRKEDIAIKVKDDQLSISGEMKRDEKVGQENYFRMGRRYGRFQRSFPLPANVIDRDKITAGFEDGILKVSVPLKESLKEREKAIDIKVK
jgi:HSP20 family protein